MNTKKYSIDEVGIRLVKERKLYSTERISSPEVVLKVLADFMRDFDREVVYVVNLTAQFSPINVNCVSTGTLNNALFHPREIFKSAILSNATGIMILHVHPSGYALPSPEDIRVTDRIVKAGDIVGIDVIDHVIVGANNFFSFRQNSMLKDNGYVYCKSVDEIRFSSYNS